MAGGIVAGVITLLYVIFLCCNWINISIGADIMGAAGQGLGVAAMMPEKEAFPFAAINMVLTAICATALVSIPSVKEMLLNIVSAD